MLTQIPRSRHLVWLAAFALVSLSTAAATAQVRPIRPDNLNRAAQPKKREPLTPAERLVRDFQTGQQSGAFLGVLMHSLDRVLSGEADKTEFDLAVEQSLARNPELSRAALTRMVADYKAVPVDVRAKAMPRELAILDRGTGLSFDQARQLAAARPGATGIIVQGGLQAPGVRVGMARAPTTMRSEGSAAPRIHAVSALVDKAERKIVLDGSFAGSSPVVPIYLKPAEGQSLDEAGFQAVDGERVAVVLGRVNGGRSRIEGTLPVGLAPGKYNIAVRVPRGPSNEPKSNSRTLDIASYAYTVRLLSIKCIDESNPESLPNPLLVGPAIPVSDEIVVSWAAFADVGVAEVGRTSEYEGFDDNTEKQIKMQPRDEGGIFMRADDGASSGVVANRLFVLAQLWESDASGSDFSMMQDGRFFADIGRASMDELDVQQFLERLSQALYWSMAQFRGSHESLGEVRLSFSAGELQGMTNNEAGRHRGEMRFMNSDSKGSYVVNYEIRRHAVPK